MQFNSTPFFCQIKVFAVISAATLFLFGFQWSVSSLLDKFTGEPKFAVGANIGSFPVGGHTRESAIQALSEQVELWRNQDRVQLFFQDKVITISNSAIAFDIPSSVQQASLEGFSSLHISINQDDLSYYIDSLLEQDMIEGLERTSLTQSLLDTVGQLPLNTVRVNLADFIIQDVETAVQTVADVKVSTSKEDSLLLEWLSQIEEIKIQPQERSSLLSLLEAQNIHVISSPALDLLASAFYQAVLQTNFEVIERNIGRELPPYVNLGAEAKVIPGKSDFVFLNPNPSEYTVHIRYNTGVLHLLISGTPLHHQYRMVKEDERSFPPKTIIHYNSELSPQAITVKEEGLKGNYVRVYREALKNQQVITREAVGEDFYPPIHRIEERNMGNLPTTSENGLSLSSMNSGGTNPSVNSAEEAVLDNEGDVEFGDEYTEDNVIVIRR